MCNTTDVLNSTHCAGNVMVSTLFEYGGQDLGNGIRKLAGESYVHGYYKGYLNGHLNGQQIGIVEGVLGTIIVYGVIKLTTKGVRYLVNKIETKDKNIETADDEKLVNSTM